MELEGKAVKLKLDRNPKSVFLNVGPVHGPPSWTQSPSNLAKAADSLRTA